MHDSVAGRPPREPVHVARPTEQYHCQEKSGHDTFHMSPSPPTPAFPRWGRESGSPPLGGARFDGGVCGAESLICRVLSLDSYPGA